MRPVQSRISTLSRASESPKDVKTLGVQGLPSARPMLETRNRGCCQHAVLSQAAARRHSVSNSHNVTNNVGVNQRALVVSLEIPAADGAFAVVLVAL